MLHKHHHHVSPEALQQQIHEAIILQGFALRHVLPSAHEPGFSYTVGLHRPGSHRPELFLSGLKVEIRVAWLLDLGFRIQGPPPLDTRLKMAQTQGVSVQSIVFPPGGDVFQPGFCYRDLAENGLPTCFGEVDPEHYETHVGQAIGFHKTASFPLLQMVWSDVGGHFLWEAQFDRRFKDTQHLLFDPQRFLPLKETKEECQNGFGKKDVNRMK